MRPMIFRLCFIVVAAATISAGNASVAAAQYYYPPGDPCYGITGQKSSGGYVYQMTPAQVAQACQEARAAAAQKRRAEAAAARARAAEEQRAADRARAVADYKAAAENAPGNQCREPKTAGALIDAYNDLDWEGWTKRRIVDIEHLVTLKSEGENEFLACHGVWVHTNGVRLEGTMTMRFNVAGKPVVSWRPEGWNPRVPDSPTSPVVAAPPSTQLTNASSPFDQGLADRRAWEEWFGATTGDFRTGALYWSGQRSLSRPGSCTILSADALAGCQAAQARLSPTDARRRTEPEYRAGWNSAQVSGQ